MKNKATIFMICISTLFLVVLGLGVILVKVANENDALIREIEVQKEKLQECEKQNAFFRGEIRGYEEQIAVLTDKGNGIEAHGQLTVKEGQLISQSGEPVILRGMSSHGIQWYPEYINASALSTLKEYGANVFRVAMYTAHSDGYVEDSKQNKIYVYQAIENALSQDMYVIVDWHVLRDENPIVYMEEALEFFAEVSERYAEEKGIIYEICNEPNGSVTWEDVKYYAEKVIPVIRENAPEAVIIVGVPSYSTDLLSVIDSPLEMDNIMYAFHQYVDISKEDHYDSYLLDKAMEEDLPVFVTEWGISYGDLEYEQVTSYNDTDLHWKAANEFIEYMERYNISWCGWALSNKAEEHGFIWDSCDKLSDWTEEDLTPSGWFMKNSFLKRK